MSARNGIQRSLVFRDCVFQSKVKLRLCGFSVRFTLFLNDGWSINLLAIENQILGIRYIERKMRPILRTVKIAAVANRRAATNIAATPPSVQLLLSLFEDELSLFLSWVYFTGPANEPQCHHLSYR